jgi:hypothetical protein
MKSMRALVGIWAVLLTAGASAGHGQIVSGVVASVSADVSQGLKNLPYSATRKTTLVQKLADGTTITQQTSTKEARDSQGRTRTETKPFGLTNSSQVDFTHVSVNDPIARTWITWTTQSKQATLMHLPEPREMISRPRQPTVPQTVQPTFGATANAASTDVVTVRNTAAQPGQHPEFHRENLGGKVIGNLYAEGVRTTTTLPAGMMGNDRPIVTVSETWTSPDLKIVLLQTTDDPRSGLHTIEVTDLDRNEPDPSLFQVPAGYTIKEQSSNQLQ